MGTDSTRCSLFTLHWVGVWEKNSSTKCEQKGKQTANVLGDYKFQKSTYYASGRARRCLSSVAIYSERRCAKSAIRNVNNRNLCDLLPAANIVSDSFHGSFTFIFSFFTNPRKQTSANTKWLDRISFLCFCMRGCEYIVCLRGSCAWLPDEH